MSSLGRGGNFPHAAIGREAAELVFFEVQRHKDHFFVSIPKDSTVADIKRMLKQVIDPRGGIMELHRPFVTCDKYTKLSDKTILSSAGYLPDNSTPDRPAILVLTIGDGEFVVFGCLVILFLQKNLSEPFCLNNNKGQILANLVIHAEGSGILRRTKEANPLTRLPLWKDLSRTMLLSVINFYIFSFHYL